jgi:predicted neutral ceramidase superfamily lipid hydrolase
MKTLKKWNPLNNLPLFTFLVFIIAHVAVSQYYPTNSWGGSLIFYFAFLPVAMLVSFVMSNILQAKLKIISIVIFYVLFLFFFMYYYPTIEEINLFGIPFN